MLQSRKIELKTHYVKLPNAAIEELSGNALKLLCHIERYASDVKTWTKTDLQNLFGRTMADKAFKELVEKKYIIACHVRIGSKRVYFYRSSLVPFDQFSFDEFVEDVRADIADNYKNCSVGLIKSYPGCKFYALNNTKLSKSIHSATLAREEKKQIRELDEFVHFSDVKEDFSTKNSNVEIPQSKSCTVCCEATHNINDIVTSNHKKSSDRHDHLAQDTNCIDHVVDMVKDKIEYDSLVADHPEYQSDTDNLVNIVSIALAKDDNDYIHVNRVDVKVKYFKEKFRILSREIFEHILVKLSQVQTSVAHNFNYILTSIYNALTTFPYRKQHIGAAYETSGYPKISVNDFTQTKMDDKLDEMEKLFMLEVNGR